MIEVRLSGDRSILANADILVMPAFAEASGPQLADVGLLEKAGQGERFASALRRDAVFQARPSQLSALLVPAENGPAVLAAGLGPRETFSANTLRDALMAAAIFLKGRGRCVVVLDGLGLDIASAMRAATEACLLGGHGGQADESTIVDLLTIDAPGAERGFAIGKAVGKAANWVRELVETPGNKLVPEDLAEVVATRARQLGIGVDIWGEAELAKRGFGATRAVGYGSVNKPLVLCLNPNRPKARLGLAGKGITFDSGGINLKRNPQEIVWMKADMAAAAAVAGAIFAAVELGFDPDVTAILPLAENMPGSHALRPGDVVTHPDGRRTEITDTDSEGRLVLADAVAYLARSGVGAIVDVGTLTDGGGVGPLLWGCWTTSNTLAEELIAAGETAGEPGWRLPLRPEYERLIESKVADIANAALAVPDSGQLAATYLRTFAGKTPWVHIDNGSTAYLDQGFAPWPVGATGSPTRALLQFLLSRAQVEK
ncbi:leucyl aminopeptidase family protein [Pseudaminobacter soli (ex Li et al. 2025)]|nr:M17 family peptidase N-terminal domain-containing protein [Mesorhizobium soli]